MAALTAIRSRLVGIRATRRSALLCLAAGAVAGASVACGSDQTGPVIPDGSQVFFTLRLNHRGINLTPTSPYDTVQLTAVALAGDGSVMTGVGPVTYTTKDSSVTVSSTGLVTAHYQTNQTTVIASLTVDGVTLKDTAVIRVRTSPFAAPLASVTLIPVDLFGDPTTPTDFVDDYGNMTLMYGVRLTNGSTVCDEYGCNVPVQVSITSSDPNIATVDQYGTINPHQIGHVTFYLSTFAYGVAKTDSLPFVVGYSGRILAGVQLDSSTTPISMDVTPHKDRAQVMSVGGRVFVTDYSNDPAEITVTPTGPGVTYPWANNSANQLADTLVGYLDYRPVRFDSAGKFIIHYRFLNSGATGTDTVVVRNFP